MVQARQREEHDTDLADKYKAVHIFIKNEDAK